MNGRRREMEVPKARENFVRMCLLIDGVICEILKYVMEVHISPNRIYAKYERFLKAKGNFQKTRKIKLYHWHERALQKSQTLGYRDMDLAVVFWILQNLLMPRSIKTYQRKTEDIRHSLNKLYSKRFKGYLSDDDFRSMEATLVEYCESIQIEVPTTKMFQKTLKMDMTRHIPSFDHELIVEKFIRSCSAEEGWLLERESIRGESAYISLQLPAESLPRYYNNRSTVERLNKRLVDWSLEGEVVTVSEPVVYLGGEINESRISLVSEQSKSSADLGSRTKRQKIRRDEVEKTTRLGEFEVEDAYLSMAVPEEIEHNRPSVIHVVDACLVYFMDDCSSVQEAKLQMLQVEKEVANSQLNRTSPVFVIIYVQSTFRPELSSSGKHGNIIWKVIEDTNDLRLHVMSALEGRMIQGLKQLKGTIQEGKSGMDRRKRRKVCTQVEAILNQFRQGSSIFSMEFSPKREIPAEIEVVLGRYQKVTFLQGFWGNELRIYIDAEAVDKQAFIKIKEEILNCCPSHFHWAKIRVIHAVRIDPKHFLGQGTKLFRHDPRQPGAGCPVIKKECYATLGCFAKSNENDETVLTSSHFVNEHCANKSVYVETEGNDSNVLLELGHCMSSVTTNQEPYVEVAVVKVSDKMKDTPHERRLLDEKENPKNTNLLSQEINIADLIPIPVFKKGATTGWTEGVIRATTQYESMKNVILVESMDDNDFADEGDSGSIVFRHSGDAEDKVLDALAMVLAGEKVPENTDQTSIRRRTFSSSSTASESGQSTDDEAIQDLEDSIFCSDLAKSLRMIETKHGMRITFFCDDEEPMQL